MNSFQKVIDHFGGVSETKRALDCSYQAVIFWRDGQRKISAETAMLVERLTHRAIRCDELCPDLDWDYIRKGSAKPRLRRTQIAQAATETVAGQGA